MTWRSKRIVITRICDGLISVSQERDVKSASVEVVQTQVCRLSSPSTYERIDSLLVELDREADGLCNALFGAGAEMDAVTE